MATYQYAVRKFKVAAKSWLSDEDYPAIITLENLASQLDGGNTSPAMVSQFGLTYRSLLKRQPTTTDDGDELDGIIPD